MFIVCTYVRTFVGALTASETKYIGAGLRPENAFPTPSRKTKLSNKAKSSRRCNSVASAKSGKICTLIHCIVYIFALKWNMSLRHSIELNLRERCNLLVFNYRFTIIMKLVYLMLEAVSSYVHTVYLSF